MRHLLFLVGILLLALLAVAAPSRVRAQAKPAAQTQSNSASTPESARSEIMALEKRYVDAFNAKNVDAIMACYAPGRGLFVFDAVPPREYIGWDAYKKDWEALFAAYPGPVSETMSEANVVVAGSVAYGHNVQTGYFTDKNGSRVNATVRVTDVFRKIKGKWLIVQEHVSFPVDIATGKADLMSAE
jgi:ketosteroid isomerase-like protein